jgi:hypothetical protein
LVGATSGGEFVTFTAEELKALDVESSAAGATPAQITAPSSRDV